MNCYRIIRTRSIFSQITYFYYIRVPSIFFIFIYYEDHGDDRFTARSVFTTAAGGILPAY